MEARIFLKGGINMKKKYLLFLALAVAFLAGCGSEAAPAETPTPEPTVTAFDLGAYKEIISACRDDIISENETLEFLASWQSSYWKVIETAGGTLDADKMVDSAFEGLQKKMKIKRDAVESAYDRIRQQYKEIVLVEINGKEAEEIDSEFREMYDAYTALYSLVTSPSGSRSSFVTNASKYLDTVSLSSESLNLFLEN